MIRVGIGGWTYAPWRGSFYPPGLPASQELAFASAQLGAIEINATGYRLQSPASFARWAAAAPDGFKFSLKASRFCTNRKILAEAGEAIERFLGQGIVELGEKLGPILWQFAATKKFDPDDFGAFLKLLPASQSGMPLRHAVEPRHASFRDPGFVAMCRKAGVAIVVGESDDYPMIADMSGGFVYARLQRCSEAESAGYSADALDRWAETAAMWAQGRPPPWLELVSPAQSTAHSPADVFLFFIAGDKVRAPAAALALIERL